MKRLAYLARFFIAVPPMPLLMLGAFAVVTIVSSVLMLLEPAQTAGALTPILLLQLFACASGFDVPARRGHFDLLLTHGVPRRLIVVGHWCASALPGFVSWLVTAVVAEVWMQRGDVSLFSVGTICALLLVSTIPWATTIRLPRFSGAIGWLLILAVASLLMPPFGGLDPRSAGHSWQTWLTTSFAVVVFPPALVGQALSGRDALILVPAVLLSACAVATAIWSVGRRDIPLEAAQ
jgi:hypothetical protein